MSTKQTGTNVPTSLDSPHALPTLNPPNKDPNEMLVEAKCKLYEAREQLDCFMSKLGLTDEQLKTLKQYIWSVEFWENSVDAWETIINVLGGSSDV